MSPRYALIGDGRLATSFGLYLEAAGAGVSRWSRRAERAGGPSLKSTLAPAGMVLLAISDGAITDFAKEHRASLDGRQLVHFSGAHVFEGIASAHPLYSFPRAALSTGKMEEIAFVTEQDGPTFGELFPMLKNKSFALPKDQKPLYHALAVLSGNLVSFTWNEAARVMKEELGLPPEEVLPAYFSSLIDGFRASPFDSLTGPVARGDSATIGKNLASLSDQPVLRPLYDALIEAAGKKGYPR